MRDSFAAPVDVLAESRLSAIVRVVMGIDYLVSSVAIYAQDFNCMGGIFS